MCKVSHFGEQLLWLVDCLVGWWLVGQTELGKGVSCPGRAK